MADVKKEWDYEKLADICRDLANPTRLKILHHVSEECCKDEGCCSVTQITIKMEISQPNVSKNLKILKENDILEFQRDGNKVLYKIGGDENISLLLEFLQSIKAGT